LLCFNDFTGAIDVNASGGVGNYEYSYDGGTIFTASSSSNFIAAGTYNIVVQDMNGCQATGTATVTQPTQLVFGLFNTFDATCNGVCDGGVTAFPSGGTVSGLYNFNWSNALAGTNQAQAANVCAGNYSLTVTDDNGCQIDTTWTISEPPAVVIDTITGVNALCFGDCNASINITAPLATQFSIDNGNSFQASGAFANLCPGTYNVEVQDAAGCPAFGSITVTVPDLLTLAVNNDTTICSGAVDTLYAWGTGGVQPYTYAWSNGATNYFEVINPVSDTSLSVIITDFNGCVTNAGTSNIFLFPQLLLTAMTDTIVCPGGSVTLTSAAAGGQAPYNYVWSSGGVTANTSVTPPSPTNYIITVTDACNVSVDDTVFVDYYALPQIAITSDVTQGCSPLAVQFTNTTPAGQIGGNCIWTIDGQTFNGCAGPSYTFLQPGCHDVTLQLTSSDGCVHDSTFVDAVCVFAIPVADFSWTPAVPTVLNSTVTFTDESSNAATYTWDFAGLGNSTASDPVFNFDPDSSGNYTVCLQIVSPDGCVDDTCKVVFIADEYLLYVPNTFTPDNDGINEVFLPVVQAVDPEHYELMIFNRWGELIFQTQNVGQGWDGTYKAVDAKQDVYVWKIKCRDLNTGTAREYYGHVNLLR
jgi:gliding motility-associated-like protein